MKSIRIHAYGGADAMQLEDAPVPECGASDLLVRVVAAGVNPIDWKIRSGAMAQGAERRFPFTLRLGGRGHRGRDRRCGHRLQVRRRGLLLRRVRHAVAATPSTWRWMRRRRP
ncbi:MAG: hypothetical protein MZV49_05655 [Rhodopseudomonas palustris]|nr:hypothetical protein [Rhodopseudomonas palustris]